MNKYQSNKPFCQYAVASKYLGCYRVFIVPGYFNVLNIIENNFFICGSVVEKNGIVLYGNVRDAVALMNRLNLEKNLDPILCFEKALPQIKENLLNPELVFQTSNAIWKFIDDCFYSDQRYSEYYKLKKVSREYYS